MTAEPLGGSELQASGEYQGRVLEVLLNGRYDGPSHLDGSLEWHGVIEPPHSDLVVMS